MIGIVVVSHSARLAEGVCELAAQVAQERVRLAAAGGTSDPQNPIGTDAFRVLDAIESVYSADGVVVFTDLGSAVLSAETALEMLPEERRSRVRLSSAPVVEGAVSAATLAAAGAGLEELVGQARAVASAALAGPVETVVTIPSPLGLHARPAAQLVRLARKFDARITIENLTHPAGPFDAGGIQGLLRLSARQGHRLAVRAEGAEASAALLEISQFLETLREELPLPPRVGGSAAGDLHGIPGAAGIAIGPLARLRPVPVVSSERTVADPDAEQRRLREAILAAQAETRSLYEWTRTHAGAGEAGIFDAQSLFLEDPELAGTALQRIAGERIPAERAWNDAAGKAAAAMDRAADAYLRARAADVRDVAARVLRKLSGTGRMTASLCAPSIVTAHDLSPSEASRLDPAMVLGVCLEAGAANAHSVILVRAMGIPAVVGVGPGIGAVAEGKMIALDGESGAVWVEPDADRVAELERRRDASLEARRQARAERRRRAATRDGRRIHVYANLSHHGEVVEALDQGAEGVGVLRTEFLFLGRAEAPGEEEQAAVYSTIAAALGDQPLVIRTLDIGGDKALPYVETGEEANPFLGWRGIRVTLSRRDLLRTQLRAIARAGAGGAIEVLFPMISTVAELREAKSVLKEAEGGRLKVGVMIEVPSAVAVADQLAREVDFFSIGTNDLIQYVMAADRTNAKVASMADPFQPAVLRTVRQAIGAGREAGIGVTLCGELAADPLATPLLLGFGLTEFSVSAPLIPALKHAIARWTAPEAEAIAAGAMNLDTSEAVRQYLHDRQLEALRLEGPRNFGIDPAVGDEPVDGGEASDRR